MIDSVVEVHNEGNTVVVKDVSFADIAVCHTEIMYGSKSIQELYPAINR